jgi:hypothetical protein
MNRENIKKVRDHIATLTPAHFDMKYYETEKGCGTVTCIAGWAKLLLAPDEPKANATLGAKLFGLDIEAAWSLFHAGEPDPRNPLYASRWGAGPSEAVRVLDHLLETGKVDWSIIDQPEAQANG